MEPLKTVPEELMARGRVAVASEKASDFGNQCDRITQQGGRLQLFFFA